MMAAMGGAEPLTEEDYDTIIDRLAGIAADRVTAQGFGSSRSVADNGSPEGRANNRRVEIVVQPSSAQ